MYHTATIEFFRMTGQEQHELLRRMVLRALKNHYAHNGRDKHMHEIVMRDMDGIINTAWITIAETEAAKQDIPFGLTAYRAAAAAMMKAYRADRECGHIDKHADADRMERSLYPATESAALFAWATSRATRTAMERAIITGLQDGHTTRQIAVSVGYSQTAIIKGIRRIRRRIEADLWGEMTA